MASDIKELPPAFSTITAYRAGQEPRKNVFAHTALKRDVRKLGLEFHEGHGVYQGNKPEPTLLVPHGKPEHEHAINALGKKYGQESVYHQTPEGNKLTYTTGPHAGKSHFGQGHEVGEHLTDNYTKVGNLKFSGNLDFSKKPEKLWQGGTAGTGRTELHGWVSPEGEFHKIPDTMTHGELFTEHHFHPGVTHENVFDPTSGPHYKAGWIGVGHGGSQSVSANHEVINNPKHPAVQALKKLVDKHWHGHMNVDTGAKMTKADTNTFAKKGTIKEALAKGGMAHYDEGGVVAPAPDMAQEMSAPPIELGGENAPAAPMPQAELQGVPMIEHASGAGGHVHPDDVHQAVMGGGFSFQPGTEVPVISPNGEAGTIPAEDAQQAFSQGYQFDKARAGQSHIKTLLEAGHPELAAAAQGAMQMVAGPLAPYAQVKAAKYLQGVPEEQTKQALQQMSEEHPLAFTAGQIGAFAAPMGIAKGITTAGELGMEGLAKLGVGSIVKEGGKEVYKASPKFIAKVGSSALRGAIETGLADANDVASQVYLAPDEAAQSAIIDQGIHNLPYVMGGGAALTGGVSALAHLATPASQKLESTLRMVRNRYGVEGEAGNDLSKIVDLEKQAKPVEPLQPETRAGMSSQRGREMHQMLRENQSSSAGFEARDDVATDRANLQATIPDVFGTDVDSAISDAKDFNKDAEGEAIKKAYLSESKKNFQPIGQAYKEAERVKNGLFVDADVKDGIGTQLEQVKTGAKWSEDIKNRSLKAIEDLQERIAAPEMQTLGGLEALKQDWLSDTADKDLWDAHHAGKKILNQAMDDAVDSYGDLLPPDQKAIWRKNAVDYRVLRNGIDEDAAILRPKHYSGPETYHQAVDKNLSNEQFYDRITKDGNAEMLQRLQETKPQTAALVRESIRDKALREFMQNPKGEAQVNNINGFREYDKLSKPMKDFAFSPDEQNRLEAIRSLLKNDFFQPGNPSHTAGTLVKLAKGLAGNSMGLVIGMTHGPVAGVAATVLQHIAQHLTSEVPDGLRLAFLKFAGTPSAANGQAFETAAKFFQWSANGRAKLQAAVKNYIKGSGNILPTRLMPSMRDLSALDKMVQSAGAGAVPLQSHQEDQQGSLSYYAPEHHAQVAGAVNQALSYLHSIRPEETQGNVMNRPMPPSAQEKQQYNRALQVGAQPAIVLDWANQGTLTPQDMQHLDAMYPQMRNSITQEVTNIVSQLRANGQMIPYKQRLGLSTLTGQPMDDTMTQQSIAGAQPAPQQPQQSPQAPQGGKKKVGQPSKLAGTVKNAQTPEESRNARRD
jgi:hypothetical protein